MKVYEAIAKDLSDRNILKQIGYDAYGNEIYAFFSANLDAKGKTLEHEQCVLNVKKVMEFVSKRDRAWQMIFFSS